MAKKRKTEFEIQIHDDPIEETREAAEEIAEVYSKPARTPHTITVTAELLNVRAEPSQEAMVLHQLVKGETLTVYDSQFEDWYTLTDNGFEYIMKKFTR
ncbi:MAG: SH3 domain-containing protein [Lachnospiraceae bacterium]|jgi:uncharacterized protein YgiM (DUF1202 family)|nr:SH3 domain-containing protein [Lachnospiraceae bacterium]